LEFAALLLSFLVGLVRLGWVVAEDDEMGRDLVALVVAGIKAAGVGVVVFVGAAADGKSLIHTAPETK
jgi:hypothetical protein